MVRPHPMGGRAGSSGERSTLMTETEFEDFWALLAARGPPHHLQEASPASQASPSLWSPSEAAREDGAHRARPGKPALQRCGTCRGCTATDCGQCKNCRDKTK